MSDIIIKEKTVEMVIKYQQTYTTEAEMIDAVRGATELRGLVPKAEEECPNEEVNGQV